jgi:CubicO group peptidase (beta-lactamase class C family)
MHEPGARFSYGIGVDIVGLIVEPLSGMTLERFFAERITGPLGMHATSFELPRDSSALASLHERGASSWSEIPIEQIAEPPRGGGGLYTTAADYLALLRLLLNDGTADDGRRLLSAQSVAAMTTNQIGELRAEKQMTAYPARTCDFEFMDGSQKFGLGTLIETRDRPDGRRRESYGWGGIFNTFFWVDPATGNAAVLMMQLRPFCDPGCVSLYREFERAVYRSLPRAGARRAPAGQPRGRPAGELK